MQRLIFLISAILLAGNLSAQITDSAKRHVVLEGASNFRDLGGYATTDGHHLKWGKVYRSADISKLTQADLDLIKKRDITTVIDLRGHQEQSMSPDRLNPGTDYILCPAGSDNLGSWMKNISKLKGNAGDSLMMAYYSNIDSLAARYKPMFDKLLKLPSQQSLVFHCSAGKDRTGIAATLLLTALGVPEETIMNDYLASNYYRSGVNKQAVRGMVSAMHINTQLAEAMMQVKPAYLDATINQIKKQYGSINIYLKTQLELTDDQISILKSRYLE